MTDLDTVTTTGPAGPPAPPPAPPRVRRAWRWPVGIGALVVVVSAIGVLGLPDSAADFDPDSAAPAGTRALVRVLADHGVQVEVVRSIDAVDAGTDTTLVVAQPQLVPYEDLERLVAAEDLVLIAPDAVVLDGLAVDVTPARRTGRQSADPGCDLPDATAAGQVTGGGALYRLLEPVDADADGSGAAGRSWLCHPDQDRGGDQRSGAGAADGRVGSLAVEEFTLDGGERVRVVVIGQKDLLRNEFLAQQGNAALAVRLLGRQPRLQWYVPNPDELTVTDDVRPLDLLPPWTPWLVCQLLVTVVVAMFWRGRRLGPLVHEPLPVVVRSAETQEGRARLYRQARARDRAAAALRTATLRRLAGRLQATRAEPDELADRVAGLVGGEVGEVRQTLTGPTPRSDTELVALANRLTEIEKDLTGPATGHRTDAPQDGR